ncbi:unnamed protein product [Rhizoctonia solani]|uniref:Uncharacterized protein n=1 Tax=Rhizoctonia solani TaxID=456999 RepID=A0A8H2WE21_9AGAM|nr:unnamed protein product [Rhizoctonia solani]
MPAQSPWLSPTSSNASLSHLINPTGITEDFLLFNLNPLPAHIALPNSLSESSFDSVNHDLNNHIFSLQLSSTKYHFACDQLKLYKLLASSHTGNSFCCLTPEDCLYLLAINQIEYPLPPASSAYTPNLMTNQSPQGNTAQINSIIIAYEYYAIAKLQGQDNYQVWCIHMTDMFEDIEVWDIVNSTSTRDTTTNTTTWDKCNRAALGALH